MLKTGQINLKNNALWNCKNFKVGLPIFQDYAWKDEVYVHTQDIESCESDWIASLCAVHGEEIHGNLHRQTSLKHFFYSTKSWIQTDW